MRPTRRPYCAASAARWFHRPGSRRRRAAGRRRCSRRPATWAAEPVDGGVDGVLGHDPVGRVLAAGDHDQSRHRVRDGVLARQLAVGVVLAGQQRAQAGVDALDVLAGQRLGEDLVDLVEQVVDVGCGWRPGGPCPASQSVSVVPMIQCRPHGMTNSTDFSVRRIRPGRRGSGRAARRGGCPCCARTWNWPRSPASAWRLVGPDAGGVDDLPGRGSRTRCAGLQVVHRAPTTRSPSRRRPTTRVRLATCAP